MDTSDADDQRARAGDRAAVVAYTFTLAICFSMLAMRVRPDDASFLMTVARIAVAGVAATLGGRVLLALRRRR